MIRTLALILLVAGCVTTPAEAPVPDVQTVDIQCGPRAEVLAALESEYGERTAGIGLGSGLIYEITISADGTWTIIASGPGGVSCLIADGVAWRDIPKGDGV